MDLQKYNKELPEYPSKSDFTIYYVYHKGERVLSTKSRIEAESVKPGVVERYVFKEAHKEAEDKWNKVRDGLYESFSFDLRKEFGINPVELHNVILGYVQMEVGYRMDETACDKYEELCTFAEDVINALRYREGL